jgi:hypothetical protein
MSNNTIFVNYSLLNEYNDYNDIDPVSQTARYDWLINERGVDLSLLDKENALEEYLSVWQTRLNEIAARKELLCIWSNGASKEKKEAMRREYRELLAEERSIMLPVVDLESEIDKSFPELGVYSESYLPEKTLDKNLEDFFRLNVDTLSLEELNKSIDYLQFQYEDSKIYYDTWVELTLVCYSRAIKLTNPMSYCRQGVTYIKKYDAGFEPEYQKFLKMYRNLDNLKKEREAYPSFQELRDKGYLTEDDIISRIDGPQELEAIPKIPPKPFIVVPKPVEVTNVA